MSIFKNLSIKPADTEFNRFNFSHDLMTTTDFGQFTPILSIENIIGDKYKIDISTLTRVAPMVFPTFGRVVLRLVSAFVPYYTIADDADSYLQGLKYFGSQPVYGRLIYYRTLSHFFFEKLANNPTAGNGWDGSKMKYLRLATKDEYEDFIRTYFDYTDDSVSYSEKAGSFPERFFLWRGRVDGSSQVHTSPKLFVLTALGKWYLKLFKSLGYGVSHFIDWMYNSSTQGFDSESFNLKLNAYPLLCYMKLYVDLMLPTSYYQTSPLLDFLYKVKSNYTGFVNAGILNDNNFYSALSQLSKVFYDSDYFTSAWQSPNAPLGSTGSFVSPERFRDDNTNTLLVADKDATGIDIYNNSLTSQQLRFLSAFDSFVRRNNLVGYREFNAVYARYGIKPSEMKSNYCQLVDIRDLDLQVGDVTSTSQSEDTLLGAYAGKGFISGDNNINYEAKDFGMFITCAYLVVKPVYFQGIRKVCLKTDTFDFYNPEFDGVGPQPISRKELNASSPNTVFGFTERYNDYRFMLDNINGDFAFDENMYPWHTGRQIPVNDIVAQSNNMLCYNPDSNGNYEYDRIFAVQNAENSVPYDHFYQVFHFDISAMRKIKTRNDAVGLGVGSVNLDQNGSV